jgi:flavorubredoxin
MLGMKAFHQRVMTSSLAAQHTLAVLEQMDIDRIAPQHGSIIIGKSNVETVMDHIKAIGEVGIEYVLAEDGR